MRRLMLAACFRIFLAVAAGLFCTRGRDAAAAEIEWELLRTFTYLDLAECLDGFRDRQFFEFMYKYAYVDRTPQHKFMLGLLYHHGLGVPRDAAKAARWYREAAAAGYQFQILGKEADAGLLELIEAGLFDPDAAPAAPPPGDLELRTAAESGREKLRLGIKFHYGLCADMDYDKARAWQIWAAESGDGNARNMVANSYMYGEYGYPLNKELGSEWLSGQRKQDPGFVPPVRGDAANPLKRKGSILAEARALYKQNQAAGQTASPAGGAPESVTLPDLSKMKKGEPQSLSDYAQEIYETGLAYYRGDGESPPDYFQAGLNFTEAAAFGLAEPECHFLLADIQEKGLCGDVNHYGAGKSYRIAAEMGHAESMRRLARLHEEGLGVRRSLAEAGKWYRAASAAGVPGAADDAARVEALAAGQAGEDWELSPELHTVFIDAQLRAYFNHSVYMLPDEMLRAGRYLIKAAENGQPHAQFLASQFYRDGNAKLGIPKDNDKAAAMRDKAAQAGVTEMDPRHYSR